MTVIHGDCVEVMAGMEAASVDAVVTDPPYGLGFMGKAWDALPPGDDVAREMLRVLKPGGHLLAFGGTRTYHRLAVAVEDAGFEIRDTLCWLYGSGFPKSLNLDGDHTGWGTALKPAHEPIVVARKPLVGTVAGNVLEHGTGALNIDGCRIEGAKTPAPTSRGESQPWFTTADSTALGGNDALGRWPANVVLDENAAAMLDEQTGECRSAGQYVRGPVVAEGAACIPIDRDGFTSAMYSDKGGASRFFYVAKASRRERGDGNTHPTVKPLKLMRWLVRLVTPLGGTVLDPFAGSGTTGIAAALEGFEFVGIEREAEYVEVAKARIAAARPEQEALDLEAAA